MVEIHNVRYIMSIGFIWRLCGMVGDKEWCPSQPKSLNEENMTFETLSGNIYKIMSFGGNKEKILNQLKNDINTRSIEFC